MAGVRRVLSASTSLATVLALSLTAAHAEPAEKPKPPANSPAARPAPPQANVVMPNAKQIVLLVRTSLLTLNDALRTGNYTVMHDLAAPGFREANPPQRLAQIFSTLGKQRVDLTPVAITVPKLTEPPALDGASGLLHLRGTLELEPVPINFRLVYQSVTGYWRLFGISVTPSPATAALGREAEAAQRAPSADLSPPVPLRRADEAASGSGARRQ
jgi:hypothetical protein